MEKQLLLIDGSSYIFRAFYGIQTNLSNKDGMPTNAIFGFKNMLHQLLQKEKPTHIVVVFDPKGPTFRNEMYDLYKANREAAPDDLKVQFEPIHHLVRILNLPMMVQDGFEADDLIGSLANKFKKEISIKIISGDKDLTQLIDDKVVMLDTMKNRLFDANAVLEKFGVLPENMIQYLALVGDASDNIPGARGVGSKTAVKLLASYKNLDGIYDNIEEIKGKLGEKIANSKENVYLSCQLAMIKCDIPLASTLDELLLKEPNWEKLRGFYYEMNFRDDALLKRGGKPEIIKNVGLDRSKYELITELDQLENVLLQIRSEKTFAINLETTSLQIQDAKIVGIALAWISGNPVYIPVGHNLENKQLNLSQVLELINPILNDDVNTVVGQNIKYDMMVLEWHFCKISAPIEDTMLMSYILYADNHSHGLDYLSETFLDHEMIYYEDLVGKGKNKKSFADVPLDKALEYAAEDVDATLRVHQILKKKLLDQGLDKLFYEIEMPICRVLSRVEANGVMIAKSCLAALSTQLGKELEILEKQIYQEAGEKFNINSTKQLGQILFKKLNIKEHLKKTKTRYSTDVTVLEKLSKSHKIAFYLIEYRTKTKLVNTYLDVLPKLVNANTKRIHTSYNQAVAATGRLSSNNPNLQNIPIKGEDGNKIRKAFVVPKSFYYLSADYSQIELRLLAHLSKDPDLLAAFKDNKDIHSETASYIYSINPENVTADQRRVAKSINFGIIYGMGAYRLAQEISVSNREAKQFIDAYFKKYSKIREFMDQTIAFAKEHLYVTTMFSRKRKISQIKSDQHMVRTAAERVAVNTRIQGSAADIIKRAMIEIHQGIEKNKFKTKLIMQVHDELVFEVPGEERDFIGKFVKVKMEETTLLQVPLTVDLGWGLNWQEAHG